MAGHHGRDQWQKLTLSAEKDGTVTGFKVELLADLGSYVAPRRRRRPGPRARSCTTRSTSSRPTSSACQTVLTNKTWTDAYRGAGRPEATYAIERMMDELAVELGVDPLEIREKNWIKHEEFPFTTVAGLEYDSGNYEEATPDGQGQLRVRRAAGRAEAAPGVRRPRPAGHRRLDLHRDVRPRAQPGARQPRLRRRWLGARERADARHRQGRGGHRGQRPRPGPRDGVQPDRGRPARRRRSRTSRCCTATPRSPTGAWTPTARARSSSVARRSSGRPTR